VVNLIRNFSDDFAQIVKRAPDNPAFVITADVDVRVISYGALAEYIDRATSLLLGHYKLRPGNVLMALMPNAAEALILFLSCIKNGIGYAPLPCTATIHEIGKWKNLVNPAACILGQAIQEQKKRALLSLDIPIHEIQCDSEFKWLEGITAAQFSVPPASASIFLSTSGTTGEPKAMVLDANTLWSSGVAFTDYMGLRDKHSRYWNYLPMSYLGGLFNLCLIPLATGSSIVIDEPFSGKTFLQFWPMIERHDIKTVWFVPSIIRGLLKIAERRPPESTKAQGKKLEMAFLGTAPIDLKTKNRFESLFGVQLYENFALSETTFFSTETPANIGQREESSVGGIIPYTDVKIVPIEDHEAAFDGLIGEIHVRSPFLFKGYVDESGAVKRPVDKNGYMATGDLGRLTKDNILVIAGRERDIIKKGGYFVGLREVEILAESYPAVQEAAAAKTKHDFYGESYDLYVILKDGETPETVNALQKFIHENLVQYKWPETILLSSDFPRTANGKVKRHLLTKENAL
jgi:acyl-coenzyme A synthetase/AMP-(fatty) acid ligase